MRAARPHLRLARTAAQRRRRRCGRGRGHRSAQLRRVPPLGRRAAGCRKSAPRSVTARALLPTVARPPAPPPTALLTDALDPTGLGLPSQSTPPVVRHGRQSSVSRTPSAPPRAQGDGCTVCCHLLHYASSALPPPPTSFHRPGYLHPGAPVALLRYLLASPALAGVLGTGLVLLALGVGTIEPPAAGADYDAPLGCQELLPKHSTTKRGPGPGLWLVAAAHARPPTAPEAQPLAQGHPPGPGRRER